MNSEPDWQRVNFQLREQRYNRRLCPDQVLADKAYPQPGAYRLPYDDQVVGSERKLFPVNSQTSCGKAFESLVNAVAANKVLPPTEN